MGRGSHAGGRKLRPLQQRITPVADRAAQGDGLLLIHVPCDRRRVRGDCSWRPGRPELDAAGRGAVLFRLENAALDGGV